MPDPQRAGRKPEIERPGLNGSARRLSAVKKLEPIALRVVEHDQVFHVPLIGERARTVRDFDPCGFKARSKTVERRGVGHFPTEKADALAAIGIDDDALLAVVHPERQRRARLVDALQPEQTGAVARPIAQILGTHADVTESLRNTVCDHGKPHVQFRYLSSFYTDGMTV